MRAACGVSSRNNSKQGRASIYFAMKVNDSNHDTWAGLPRAYYLLPALGDGCLNVREVTTEQECSLIGQDKEQCYLLSREVLGRVGTIKSGATILCPGAPGSVVPPAMRWKNWPHRMESMPGLISQDRDLGQILGSLWTPYTRLGGLFVGLSRFSAPHVARFLPTQFSLFTPVALEAKVIAAFVGAISAKQKVAAIVRIGDKLLFRKSSALRGGHDALRHEYETLRSLEGCALKNIYIPKPLDLVHQQNIKLMSVFTDIYSLSSEQGPRSLDSRHFSLLKYFMNEQKGTTPLLDVVVEHFDFIQDKCESRLKGFLEDAFFRGKSAYGASKEFNACFAHGDFVSWNTRIASGHLWVFDWEFSLRSAPLGLDLLHYTLWPWVVTNTGSLSEGWGHFLNGLNTLEIRIEESELDGLFCFLMVHWVNLLMGEYPGDDIFMRMQEVQRFALEVRV